MAKRQACYDPVTGARGVDEFGTYRVEEPETVYDDNAYTITSTYHNATGTLHVYTIRPTKPTDSDSP